MAKGEEDEYHKERKEKEEEKKERWEKEKEDDPSTVKYLNKGMESTQKIFGDNRDGWEFVWGSKIGRCGDFREKSMLLALCTQLQLFTNILICFICLIDAATLSNMNFAHYIPDTISSASVVAGSALQIYSIEILALNGNLSWPLKVYGVVAV